ncbi:uncharacterized protein PAC_16667 [Phialocephala subalpina]|uniref:Homeobox domain-containing protein n=1 Tax=Phialocephala subalpina TaxID=576137 RepID=A0A1L7XPA9_9HELO|nr:uncharacterized protein PAC_16667 [Phialocephala subalpina]
MESNKSNIEEGAERKASSLLFPTRDAEGRTGATPNTPQALSPTDSTPSASATKQARKARAPRKGMKFITKSELAKLKEISSGFTRDPTAEEYEQMVADFVDEKGNKKYDRKKLEKTFWDKKTGAADRAAAQPIPGENNSGVGEGSPANASSIPQIPTQTWSDNYSSETLASLRAEFDKYPKPKRPKWKKVVENVGLPKLAVQAWFYKEWKEREKLEKDGGIPQMSSAPMMDSASFLTAVPMLSPPPMFSTPQMPREPSMLPTVAPITDNVMDDLDARVKNLGLTLFSIADSVDSSHEDENGP